MKTYIPTFQDYLNEKINESTQPLHDVQAKVHNDIHEYFMKDSKYLGHVIPFRSGEPIVFYEGRADVYKKQFRVINYDDGVDVSKMFRKKDRSVKGVSFGRLNKEQLMQEISKHRKFSDNDKHNQLTIETIAWFLLEDRDNYASSPEVQFFMDNLGFTNEQKGNMTILGSTKYKSINGWKNGLVCRLYEYNHSAYTEQQGVYNVKDYPYSS